MGLIFYEEQIPFEGLILTQGANHEETEDFFGFCYEPGHGFVPDGLFHGGGSL
jgi:hypothetical protein